MTSCGVFNSSARPAAAYGKFGGGQGYATCATASLGQLLETCMPKERGGWLWGSQVILLSGHRQGTGIKTESVLFL